MNHEKCIERISGWMYDKVQTSGTDGIVIGLSGGIDSSVVLGLAKRAMGDAVLGVIMPCKSSPEDAEFAEEAALAFDTETVHIRLDDTLDAMMKVLPENGDVLAEANVKARLRMTALYYIANQRNYLVAGTGNKSELAVGYFTKYGDGGADILPIGDLLKTQVKGIAGTLGVPRDIIEKPPSAGLWEGQTDEEEMGIDYPTLDSILDDWANERRPQAPAELVDLVSEMGRRAEHKLDVPPICQLEV